ncbi:hypothetical protein D3C78_1188880 [compost metagenome]
MSQVGSGVGDLRVEALDLGTEGVDLLALRLGISLGLGHLRAGDVVFGGQGRDPFFRNVAGLAQGFGAGQVHLRATQAGLAGGDLSFAGGNQAGLLGQLALGLQALGFAGGEGGIGAIHGEAEVVTFELDQQLAFFHVLVVLHQNLVDARAQLAGDTGDFALDIGVIGAFVKPSLEEPFGKEAAGNQQGDKQENGQATLELGWHGQACSRNKV